MHYWYQISDIAPLLTQIAGTIILTIKQAGVENVTSYLICT